MLFHRSKSALLAGLASLALCNACALSPVHEGKYTFEGKVTDQSGKPVPDAWVKVRGWETLTDASGKWREEIIINCGATRDDIIGTDEANQVLVMKDGFKASEENFVVKRPAFFISCQPEQHIAFDTVLTPESVEAKDNKEAAKIKPRTEPKEIPWSAPTKKKPKGTYL